MSLRLMRLLVFATTSVRIVTAFRAGRSGVINSSCHRARKNNLGRSFYTFPNYQSLSPSDSTSTIQESPVSVFDNVLSPSCCKELTSEALYNIGPEVYRRDQGSASPQDVLIESLLSGLGFNKTREVEWWGRSTYKTVEAHRDVDEEAATARGERRYPTHSLVVYLDIEEEMRAPTCVWVPDKTADGIGKSALVSVPAVPGRMLVFSGELLHAVPCPTLSWLDSNVAAAGRAGGMRRVLVLNLWDDYAPEDEEEEWEEEWEDGYEDDGDEEMRMEEWEEEWDNEDEEDDEEEMPIIEFFAKRVECEPRKNWQSVDLQGLAVDNTTSSPLDNTLTLSTRSHGSDERLLSPLKAISRTEVAAILEGKSIPRWLWTGADVRDLGIGVPSLAGSREERTQL